jgi:hypothetical protein
VQAWNSHDLDEIVSHYAADVVLVSPVAMKILNDPSGMVRGKGALRAYFRRALEAFPNLEFELIDVTRGLSSVVLYYANQRVRRPASSWNSMPTRKSFESSPTSASDQWTAALPLRQAPIPGRPESAWPVPRGSSGWVEPLSGRVR